MVMTEARKVTCIRRKRGGGGVEPVEAWVQNLRVITCVLSASIGQKTPDTGVGGFRLHLFTEKFSKGMWRRL